jgi:hypothetical protein
MTPQEDKLNATIQIRLSEELKENLHKDLSALAEQVKKQTGIRINASIFLRLCLEDLHEKLLLNKPIVWPPRLKKRGTNLPQRGGSPGEIRDP